MIKPYRTILFALTLVLAPSLGARAQDENTMTATMPHDFVASGAVLPAGVYKIRRIDSPGAVAVLHIQNQQTGTSTFVLPTGFAEAPGEQAQVRLQRVGGKYFLTELRTPVGIYTMSTPSGAFKLAQKEQRQPEGISSSGSN
jgi:hypothetical protein